MSSLSYTSKTNYKRPFLKSIFYSFSGFGIFIFATTILLILIGVLFIHSASMTLTGTNKGYSYKQFKWIFISMVCFLFVISLNYQWIIRNAYIFYIGAIFLLLATSVVGEVRNNSKRWIKLGPLLLQTSEVMKLALIIMLAKVMAIKQKVDEKDISRFIYPFALTIIPFLLICTQPDLGTSLVVLGIFCSMAFVAGFPIKHIIIISIIFVQLSPIFYFFVLHDYQRQRIKMFLVQENMSKEQKKGDGYHLNQSKIAIGNGYILGQGWKKGTQNRYNFVPERHTDFIFSVIGEETGFVGSVIVLLLYVFLLLCILMVAYTTISPEGQFIVIGVWTIFCSQIIQNISMTIGLAPITGLPLPFISYGGSSLLFNLIGIGLILSVNKNRVSPIN